MMMERKIKVKSFNCHITCQICNGYLVDATTVTECLHTFCKSCLVKHLEENNTCAACHQVIHQSHPLQYISFDRTMQDIVYKLVPNLQELEMKRERDFYRSKGLPFPKDIPLMTGELGEEKPIPELTTDQDFRRRDEQVNVDLECKSGGLKMLKKKHIRLSSHATVTTLKKFIALKVLDSAEKYQGIEILCNNELLGKDHTLKFVYVTRWRSFPPPLRLQYRPTLLFPDNFL